MIAPLREALASVERLNPKEGDVLVLSMHRDVKLSTKARERILDEVLDVLPAGCQIVILPPGVALEKASPKTFAELGYMPITHGG